MRKPFEKMKMFCAFIAVVSHDYAFVRIHRSMKQRANFTVCKLSINLARKEKGGEGEEIHAKC